MKKTLKYCLLVALAIIILFLLTGCGESSVIATREFEDGSLGKYEMELELRFNKDKISSIKATETFENENIAKIVASGENSSEIEFEVEGNSISCVFTAEEYEKINDLKISDKTKTQIIEELETDGFVIQK